MKRTVAIGLMAAMLLNLAACGNTDKGEASAPVLDTTTTTTNITTTTTEPQRSEFELFLGKFNAGVYKEYQAEELKNIVDYFQELFITTDGSLYRLGKFSDGTNIKKIDTDVKFVKFSNGNIISVDNEVYIYHEDTFSVSPHDRRGYSYASEIFDGDYLNKVHAVIEHEMKWIASLTDNEMHMQRYVGNGKKPTDECYHRFSEEETVEYLIDQTVKTNKGYYYLEEVVNESEYDDIPTTYSCAVQPIPVEEDVIFVKYYGYYSFYLVDANGHLTIYNYVT